MKSIRYVALCFGLLSCGREAAPPPVSKTTTQPAAAPPARTPARTPPRAAAPHTPVAEDAQTAAAVVHDYYRAIASRDFERAYRAWGSSGPPGQTLQKFTAGFADTASVEVTTGTPSRVEPAAGSRYTEVPVTIVTMTKSGKAQRFEGTYTLRRTVVDGAPASDREWHLYRASIRQVTPP